MDAPADATPPALRRPLVLLLIAVLLAGAGIKGYLLPRMVTHVDDIGVANSLRQARALLPLDSVRAQVGRATGHGPVTLVSKGLVAFGGTRLLRALLVDVTVPLDWTYAPAQYLLTGALIDPAQDYAATIRAGRLPSWLFGALAPLVVALLAWTTGGPRREANALVAAAVTAGSVELALHSAQMGNYALGVCAAALMLLRLARGADRPPTPRSAFIDGALLALLTWCHYQVGFALPAWGVVRLWQWKRNGASTAAMVRSALCAALPLAVAEGALYHYFVYFIGRFAERSVAWNAGPAGEYLFTLHGHGGVAGTLAYLVTFSALNKLATVTAMTAFLPDTNSWARPIGALLLALVTLGLWHGWRQGGAASDVVAAIALMAATWWVLVVAGVFTLSPTRHSLFWLPALAWLAAHGAMLLTRTARSGAAIMAGAAGAVMACALCTTPTVLADRTNPMTEPGMRALIDSVAADLVVAHDCTEDLSLMPSLTTPLFEKACTAFPQFGAFRRPVADATLPARVLFVSTAEPMTPERFRYLQLSVRLIAGRDLLAGSDSLWRPTVVRASRQRGTTEWQRGLSPGAAGLFVTLYTRAPDTLTPR